MILVTGSTGFVGRATVQTLRSAGKKVRTTVRDPAAADADSVFHIPDIDGTTDWVEALEGVDSVIHCAARAHQMNEGASEKSEYERINTAGTINLAEACLAAGTREIRFCIQHQGLWGNDRAGPTIYARLRATTCR